ncbi:hypothetical protein EDB87DRAFT_1420796 [Lactarius vividus]|nr:hypothetical protein EDB87DRAFT_1420796 [Lactarius vividus]
MRLACADDFTVPHVHYLTACSLDPCGSRLKREGQMAARHSIRGVQRNPPEWLDNVRSTYFQKDRARQRAFQQWEDTEWLTDTLISDLNRRVLGEDTHFAAIGSSDSGDEESGFPVWAPRGSAVPMPCWPAGCSKPKASLPPHSRSPTCNQSIRPISVVAPCRAMLLTNSPGSKLLPTAWCCLSLGIRRQVADGCTMLNPTTRAPLPTKSLFFALLGRGRASYTQIATPWYLPSGRKLPA